MRMDPLSLVGKGPTWRKYCKDVSTYSLQHGDHPLIARGRQRMQNLGLSDIVRGLVDFSPSRRMSVADALRSDVFAVLQSLPEGE